jgi:hypothetical protein
MPDTEMANARLRRAAALGVIALMLSRIVRASTLGLALAFAQIAAVSGVGMCACGMADMGSMAGTMPTPAHEHAPSRSGTHQHTPGSYPMSQSACATMATCGVPVMAVSQTPGTAAMPPRVAARVAEVPAPSSVLRTPEPPPPRA